eukprot:COSAG02_NODE_2579_length_8493_cov_28.456040_6_plen_63_part_00
MQGGVDREFFSDIPGAWKPISQRGNLETFNRHHTNSLKAWSVQTLHLLAAIKLSPCINAGQT